MAENYMPETFAADFSTTLPKPPPEHLDNLIDLQTYREKRVRADLLNQIAACALDACHDSTLSCVPIDIYEDSDTINIRFAAYDSGHPSGDYGVLHYGWSGGPETKTIIAACYDKTTDEISASPLRNRNLKYVESDIRAKQRTDQYANQMQNLYRDMHPEIEL